MDIAYAFDNDGKAPPDNWPTGYVGYAYLESPVTHFNFDDDEDGLTDEKREMELITTATGFHISILMETVYGTQIKMNR
jgi:hypothetical protein